MVATPRYQAREEQRKGLRTHGSSAGLGPRPSAARMPALPGEMRDRALPMQGAAAS